MIKSKLTILILVLLIFSCQEKHPETVALSTDQLEAAFQAYKEPNLTHRRFKHADIIPLIEARKQDFQTKVLGESIHGRKIYQLAYGRGPIRVLLWSQMHGNESTATMALFDLFNFLEGKDDGFDSLRLLLQDKLHLRFIPMVNPDGAEAFQRRNALDIDLNRDAIDEITPEARILKAARDDFQPAFGFNLHDQQIYYNAKGTDKPATISLLAPAYNAEKEVNDVRRKSMQVIVGMNQLLQQAIPGHVGKYDDAFEPRAFGDNFQKWGTSTMLIESGGYPGDPEKQYIRQLNFMIILNALYEIARGEYLQYSIADYYAIPDNDNKLLDLVVRNVRVEHQGNSYQVDLGIKRLEAGADSAYSISSSIVDKGDLSVFYGYEEVNAEGLHFRQGNIWKGTYNSNTDVTRERAFELLRQGYMAIQVKHMEGNHDLPLVVVQEEKAFASGHQLGSPANFLLVQNAKPVYAVVNGYLVDLKNK